MKQTYLKDLRRLALVSLGAFSSALSIKIFASAHGLLSGGFTGVSILLSRVFSDFLGIQISFGIIYMTLNIFPTLLVFRYVGKKFTIFSLVNVVLVSLFSDLIPVFYVTDDMLLVCVFGGMLAGAGSLLALRANASGGGTDFIAIFFSNKYNKPFWNYVLIFNACILSISGLIYGLELSLYSIIYQFTSTQLVNVFHNRYKLVTLSIITEVPEEVSQAILAESRHGITRFDGVGMYSKTPKTMLYMVVNAFEVEKIVHIIKHVDQKVFINESKSRRVVGNFHQQPFD